MEADLDIDVVIHLGFLKNIDMLNRGLYNIEVTMRYSQNDQLIHPIGLFSAPSGFDCSVGDQRVPGPGLIRMCNLDNANKTFTSRTIAVRYRDESHELNEGVHWRLTVPNARLDVPSSDSSLRTAFCNDILIVTFDLHFSDFVDVNASSDLLHDVASHIPESINFKHVASQSLYIQYAASDLHGYYPVTFDAANFMELDVMVHSAVTAIRFKENNIEFRTQSKDLIKSESTGLWYNHTSLAINEDYIDKNDPTFKTPPKELKMASEPSTTRIMPSHAKNERTPIRRSMIKMFGQGTEDAVSGTNDNLAKNIEELITKQEFFFKK